MYISITLPDKPQLLNYQPAYYQYILLFSLYHLRQLSEKEICETLNLTRREFADLLTKYNFSALSDDAETIKIECQL